MKTIEEIEKAAANLANPNVCKTTNWIEGYTQCQEDMADKIKEAVRYKEHVKQLLEEVERLRKESKEVNDKEIDSYINNYINDLPDGWNSRLDMMLSMKNAMIQALSYKEKYLI